MTPEEEFAARDYFSRAFAELARNLADDLATTEPLMDGPEALRLFSHALLASIGGEVETRH